MRLHGRDGELHPRPQGQRVEHVLPEIGLVVGTPEADAAQKQSGEGDPGSTECHEAGVLSAP
jgi:hypothetical protein